MKTYIYIIIGIIILLLIRTKMKKTFSDFFNAVFNVETDKADIHKVINDSGGLTKYGISDLADKLKDGKYFGKPIETMTITDAMHIYEKNYFNPYARYFIHYPNFALQIFDISINSGVQKSKDMVKKCFGTSEPNEIVKQLNSKGENFLTQILINERKNFYNQLATDNPIKYGKYLKGWFNRISNLKFT